MGSIILHGKFCPQINKNNNKKTTLIVSIFNLDVWGGFTGTATSFVHKGCFLNRTLLGPILRMFLIDLWDSIFHMILEELLSDLLQTVLF